MILDELEIQGVDDTQNQEQIICFSPPSFKNISEITSLALEGCGISKISDAISNFIFILFILFYSNLNEIKKGIFKIYKI
mgnify:CR=1 FL=1